MTAEKDCPNGDHSKSERTFTSAELALNQAAILREAAALAKNPYSDEVEAYGSDEPFAVGAKIAKAILGIPADQPALDRLIAELLRNPNGSFTQRVLDEVLIPGQCGVSGHFQFQQNGNNCISCQREKVLLEIHDAELRDTIITEGPQELFAAGWRPPHLIDEHDAELRASWKDAVLVENARLAAEWKSVHIWNNQLVTEHYTLGAKIKELKAQTAALLEKAAAGFYSSDGDGDTWGWHAKDYAASVRAFIRADYAAALAERVQQAVRDGWLQAAEFLRSQWRAKNPEAQSSWLIAASELEVIGNENYRAAASPVSEQAGAPKEGKS